MTITEQARNLRKNPSPNEKTLWSMLRAQRMGYKFVRQHPVIFRSQQNKNYVFYLTYFSRTHNLAIEVDEPVDDIQRDFFVLRDSILEEMGVKILKLKNEDFKNLRTLKQKIESWLAEMIPTAKEA